MRPTSDPLIRIIGSPTQPFTPGLQSLRWGLRQASAQEPENLTNHSRISTILVLLPLAVKARGFNTHHLDLLPLNLRITQQRNLQTDRLRQMTSHHLPWTTVFQLRNQWLRVQPYHETLATSVCSMQSQSRDDLTVWEVSSVPSCRNPLEQGAHLTVQHCVFHTWRRIWNSVESQ